MPTSLSNLPFARVSLGLPTALWDVTPTGDYNADNRRGADYADSLVVFMREADMPSLLGQVIKAMGQSHQWSGVEAGFTHRLAVALTT